MATYLTNVLPKVIYVHLFYWANSIDWHILLINKLIDLITVAYWSELEEGRND